MNVRNTNKMMCFKCCVPFDIIEKNVAMMISHFIESHQLLYEIDIIFFNHKVFIESELILRIMMLCMIMIH